MEVAVVNIETLLCDRSHVAQCAEDLLQLATNPDPQPDPAAAHARMERLRQELEAHFSVEAEGVYVHALETQGCWTDMETIVFHEELDQLRAEWACYLAVWTDSRIAAQWQEFLEATAWLMPQLLRWIDDESAVLFPLAEASGPYWRMAAA